MQEPRKNKVQYTPEARHDLDDIWNHIVSNLQNRTAAENTVNRIMDAVDQMETYALIGPPLSAIAEMDGEYRFLVSGNYSVWPQRLLADSVFRQPRNTLRDECKKISCKTKRLEIM